MSVMQEAISSRHDPADLTMSEMDRLLDEALRMTFPASDPIAINIERVRPLDRPVAVPEAGETRAGEMNTRN